MQRWEYKFLLAAQSGFEKKMVDLFAAAGSEGWELVLERHGYFIFKRLQVENKIAEKPQPGTAFANGVIRK